MLSYLICLRKNKCQEYRQSKGEIGAELNRLSEENCIIRRNGFAVLFRESMLPK
jgi:hypothetical protein